MSWNETTNCCIWNGVVCNLAGQVTGLDLSREAISSGINQSSILFSLQKLHRLNFAYNNFNFKRTPSRLSNLTSLFYLNLSNSGKNPGIFSNLTRLKVVDLSSNRDFTLQFEKPRLAKLVQNLPHLTDLYLDGVNMSAHKFDWSQVLSSSLPDLKVLSFSDCCLSGIDESFQKLQSLSLIDLSYNNLSTHVPYFFCKFPKFDKLKSWWL